MTGGAVHLILGRMDVVALCLFVHYHPPLPIFQLICTAVLIDCHFQNLSVSKGMKIHNDEGLESILNRSRCHKGRLLYYFPAQQG
jgi:hypothetical protein